MGSKSQSKTVAPTSIPLRLLQEITDGFSEERKLGQGAYGKVYRGEHKTGEEIAVKMLYNDSAGLDGEQFQNEFHNLMRLEHPNIVRLVGYCYETQHEYILFNGKPVFAEKISRALCFEYMHNGSLQNHLSDEFDGLDWHTRYKIIKGTCEGLKYLHKGLKQPIYHLDLKPDNILLDKNMEPKLADFGLSKLFGEEQTRITQSPIGTFGYLPMEYLNGQVVSKKLDIFSLGVVMIKIIAGPMGRSESAEMPAQEFIDLVHRNWRDRLQATWSGSTLEAYCQQVKRCTEIALVCVEDDRHKRPNIVDITNKLIEIETVIEKLKFDVGPALGKDREVDRLAENFTSSLGSKEVGRKFPPPATVTDADLPAGGGDAVVLYTTSLGYIPGTTYACGKVRTAIKSLGVKYTEKNFCEDRRYVQELMRLLRTSYVSVPALFIRGKHVGQVLELQEEGKLEALFEGLPRL